MDIMTMFDYSFMRMAFLAILIITPLFGLLGTMIVNKKMAYFSDALGHSALTGIAVGVICGMHDTTLSMILFAIVFALLLNWINAKAFASTDTVISVFSSCAIAIGLAILSRGGSFSQYSGILVGDVLSITMPEVTGLFAVFIITIIFYLICYNAISAIAVSPILARSRHIRVYLLESLFSVLVAVIVTVSIKWVGILIINALLILPAASARNVSQNARSYSAYAVIFAMFSGIVGLFVSYFTNVATGPMIVIIASAIYFGTLLRPFRDA
ncbi:MAG: metal ABC transporter permease [Agathobacter sp.]|uniref:metal ABC transporter permease n=1 Tax=Agathobacter sp. TaxID=2021311 RepID=UPI00257E42B3|nr:metal ABC transporter permease [Agathobacter sp.]MBQ1681721.1 metal ABC transporter permease [Agathobacter sp.]